MIKFHKNHQTYGRDYVYIVYQIPYRSAHVLVRARAKVSCIQMFTTRIVSLYTRYPTVANGGVVWKQWFWWTSFENGTKPRLVDRRFWCKIPLLARELGQISITTSPRTSTHSASGFSNYYFYTLFFSTIISAHFLVLHIYLYSTRYLHLTRCISRIIWGEKRRRARAKSGAG